MAGKSIVVIGSTVIMTLWPNPMKFLSSARRSPARTFFAAAGGKGASMAVAISYPLPPH